MLYQDNGKVYLNANNKFYEVEVRNKEIAVKSTKSDIYALKDAIQIPTEDAIKLLSKKSTLGLGNSENE